MATHTRYDAKADVASEVQSFVLNLARRGIGTVNPEVMEVTTSAVSKLETQVRVKTKSNGTQYFTVKVSSHN